MGRQFPDVYQHPHMSQTIQNPMGLNQGFECFQADVQGICKKTVTSNATLEWNEILRNSGKHTSGAGGASASAGAIVARLHPHNHTGVIS